MDRQRPVVAAGGLLWLFHKAGEIIQRLLVEP